MLVILVKKKAFVKLIYKICKKIGCFLKLSLVFPKKFKILLIFNKSYRMVNCVDRKMGKINIQKKEG